MDLDLNVIAQSLLEKIKTLPDGTEISTSELMDSVYTYSSYADGVYSYGDFSCDTKDYFKIHSLLRQKAKENGIELDSSRYAGMALGLPFHIGFVIRCKKNRKSMSGEIIVLPEHEELKREVEKLRAEVPMLILERDNLRLIECRNLETAYMLSIGALEHKVFEMQCTVLRLKRKLEMIQAKRNRQEKIILQEIEETLDIEFAAYQQKINEQIQKMNEAIEHSNGKLLTKEETKEIKKMYSAIVKAMHPDLHPNQTQEERELFINAIKAYKNGDIETIRLIFTMRGEFPLPESHEDATKALYREKERLEKILQSIRDEIAAIKSKFPYTMREFLNDEKQIAAKKEELENIVRQYQEAAELYNARIKELTG